MHSSGSISPYQGADPDLLHALTRMLEDTGRDLFDHRTAAERVLTSVGGSTAAVADLRLVEAWVADAAADTRRRAAACQPAASEVAPALVIAAWRPVDPTPPRPVAHVLHRTTTIPVFEPDALSGMGISGYAVVGLAYHHLGVERRTVTTVVDHGGGWIETAVEHQSRGVFEVNPGLGYGTFALASFGPHRLRDPWRKGSTTRTYEHDGQPASAAAFRAATG